MSARATRPRTVLIVDDSFLMRRIIREIVQTDDRFTVVGEAADGVEGLERVHALAPDIILLDIEMPRMDGLEFLRRARLLTDARIVVISSVAQLGSVQSMEALELGACEVMPKPSGVLSLDLAERRSVELLTAIDRCSSAWA